VKPISLPYSCGDPAVTLSGFVPGGENKPAILCLPGGGYQVCAPREGLPVAERFAEMGYAAFVLEYSTMYGSKAEPYPVPNGHVRFPEPLREVALAVKLLRERAAQYGLDPHRLALFGASAGGHLAACYACRCAEVFGDLAPAETLRPDALVLLYCASEPEYSAMMLEPMYGHDAPFSWEEKDRWAVKRLVNGSTPPTVLFHGAGDRTVAPALSISLFGALQAAGVESELHVFRGGGHAFGLGADTPAARWPELADDFLRGVWG